MFNKIVCIDRVGITLADREKIQKYSKETVIFTDSYPSNEKEIISRIGDADAVLVSWFTSVSENVIHSCPNLVYIGMCSTLYEEEANTVDLKAAREKGITVTGVRDYGDEGVAEFILGSLISLCNGTTGISWKKQSVELGKRKVGLIGMGAVSQTLARFLLALGTTVSYYSKSRKQNVEEMGISYLKLEDLLKDSEIVSIHVPKNTALLSSKHFEILGESKVLVSTSFGFTFQKEDLKEWLNSPKNFAILDGDTLGNHHQEFEAMENVIATNKTTGWTKEAEGRLSSKVILNLKNYFKK